jgi:hypothetical protein
MTIIPQNMCSEHLLMATVTANTANLGDSPIRALKPLSLAIFLINAAGPKVHPGKNMCAGILVLRSISYILNSGDLSYQYVSSGGKKSQLSP